MRRLLALRQEGALTTRQVQLAARCLAVTERTVWRWLAAAEQDPAAAREPGSRAQSSIRFTVTPEVRHLLALWKGNVAAVHRELTARAARQNPPGRPPSLPTLHRAIQRDLTAGERAGLAAGERAARKHNVFLTRPRGHRNQVWETDHMQAPVLVVVDTDAQPRRPWITWFVDCATNAIAGLAITPGHPSRESVLAALRSAVLRTAPYGPVGGLPQKVRVDRGKDFLSCTVTAAFGALGVEVEPLPPYTPHLKGTVEGLNRSVERMHLAALPGYVHRPRPGRRPGPADRSALLSFEEFTAGLLAWAVWWNTEHRPAPLGGKTPLQVWQDDPTPVREIPQADLWAFTLEDDRAHPRAVTTRGVKFKGRFYIAAWMTSRTGTRVSVRYMPHHDHEIELFDPATGRHLATAHLANEATAEQVAAVRRTRAARARGLAKDLKDAQRRRHERYAAATGPEAPRLLGPLTAAEADGELAAADLTDLAALALPDLLPLAAPPPGLPVPASVAARLATAAPQPAEPRPAGPAPAPASGSAPGFDPLPAEEES
ncbi:Mu transposase C-terminal domain-containing protein [Kitasatospora misakiensis]|uniref:Mu transposase C-terminal domain-containing protein n=1 Tax=Kitasatospora misakiensis TaxID=67330 RepID=A0ABW0X7B0_9ACTN